MRTADETGQPAGGAPAKGQPRHATSGTRAAQMATNPKAIPVAVRYARIVRAPPRLDQNGGRAPPML